ncbi:MAG: leucine-rich repeat protein [Spirochaetaceae bacterium]|nr:leucine-rich repeat protein [Spirochaetaceae bacterium]
MKKNFESFVLILILANCFFVIVGCKDPVSVIEPEKTGTIQGTVIYDNATVSDYSGIQVSLFSSNGLMASNNCITRTILRKSRSLESVGITNSKGEYIFENVPEGVYTIYASSNSSTQKAVATNVVVRASETVTPDVLGLTATGSLSGQVYIDYSIDGVLGLDVFIPGTSFIAKVDEDGYFEISNIPISTGYELYIQKGEKVLQLYDSEEIDIAIYYSGRLGTSYLNSAELESDSFKWLGSFWETPENPELNNAYFNYNDGCSYIWNGYFWDLLAQAGRDGEDGRSINWIGSYGSSDWIYYPEYLDVYYNTSDGCSYIYTNSGWEILTLPGKSINWLGSYYSTSAAQSDNWPTGHLDAYYNTSDGCAYICIDGDWVLLAKAGADGTNGKDGEDARSINWRGSYSSSDNISNPQYLDAYYNTTDGCSYIWNGCYWDLLAQAGEDGEDGEDGIDGADGNDGQDGKSINWLGSFSSANEINNPQHLDAYRNSTDGCSYIYISEGVYTPRWQLLASKGESGLSINWRGSYASSNQISYPQKLDAYYNTIDGCSYIYNGSRWELLAQKGDTGDTGVSIKWLGSYTDSSKISNPKALNAYYNTTDGCSYIYTGSSWELLARKGTDGATSSGDGSIRWLGSFVNFNEVPNPDAMDAFFNATDGCSYIYNGTEWILLAQAGADGAAGNDGISINWLGSYANTNFIHEPKYLDAYWNTTENCAYIYDGEKWTVLTKGPASGGSGSSDPTIGTEAGANIVGTTLMSWDNAEGVIRIPNGVTDIAENVFNDNNKITRVIIPSSVVSIGHSAFYDCDKLTSVEFLGPGLEFIGANAFSDCDNLAYITLPSTLQVIGGSAFCYDSSLTIVNIPDSVTVLGGDAFAGCTMLRTLTIGSGLTELKHRTFYNCDSIVSVTIPDTVLSIADTVFVDCDNITELKITGTWNSGNVLTITDLKVKYGTFTAYSTYTRDTN